MRVVPVPVLSDNYAYLLIDDSNVAAAVDPAETSKVLAAARDLGVSVTTVLTTHSHRDHDGGNEELRSQVQGLTIYGGEKDNVKACTHKVADQQKLRLGQIDITCIETPYHTAGHMCYLCHDDRTQEDVIFTGDTLFVGGCGRNFQGTPDQMFHSLIEVLAVLPGDTKMYCGHEYTVSNLKFAASVDKDNPAVLRKLEWAELQRKEGLPTVPSTIQDELQYNPFLRCGDPAIAAHLNTKDAAETLAKLRELKDNFGASAVLITTLLNVYSAGESFLKRWGLLG